MLFGDGKLFYHHRRGKNPSELQIQTHKHIDCLKLQFYNFIISATGEEYKQKHKYSFQSPWNLSPSQLDIKSFTDLRLEQTDKIPRTNKLILYHLSFNR